MKQPSLAKLRRQALKLWTDLCHLKGACEACGAKTKGLNAHHFIDKKLAHLRYEPRNAVLLCPKCHKFDSRFAFHNNPIFAVEWMQTYRLYDLQWLSVHVNDDVDTGRNFLERKIEELAETLRIKKERN
jgi:hypothetical protein